VQNHDHIQETQTKNNPNTQHPKPLPKNTDLLVAVSTRSQNIKIQSTRSNPKKTQKKLKEKKQNT
jgi:hypothetical protein